jgi:hypothetical protein
VRIRPPPPARPLGRQNPMSFASAAPDLTASLTSIAVAVVPAAVLGLGTVSGARSLRHRDGLVAWSLALAALAGICLGLAAVAGGPIAPVLAPRQIFGPESPWNLTGATLIGERFPLALAGLDQVLRTPPDTLPASVASLTRGFLAFGLAAALLPFLRRPIRAALLLLLAVAAVGAAGLTGIVYLACFGPWLLNQLNFWALGLFFLAFCYWRHGAL